MKKVKLPTYDLKEELINSISHGVGALLSIAALVLLIVKSNTLGEILTTITYGVSLINMYTISCVYHALSPKLKAKKVLRVIDHCNVMILEAGTYTPICICLFGGALGYTMFGLIWFITIVAVILNAVDVDKYQYASLACNLLLGWSIILAIKPLLKVCALPGVLLLVFGGVMYSLGAILYKMGAKKKYMHSVFHFFVIAGSILHFLMIYMYVL